MELVRPGRLGTLFLLPGVPLLEPSGSQSGNSALQATLGSVGKHFWLPQFGRVGATGMWVDAGNAAKLPPEHRILLQQRTVQP